MLGLFKKSKPSNKLTAEQLKAQEFLRELPERKRQIADAWPNLVTALGAETILVFLLRRLPLPELMHLVGDNAKARELVTLLDQASNVDRQASDARAQLQSGTAADREISRELKADLHKMTQDIDRHRRNVGAAEAALKRAESQVHTTQEFEIDETLQAIDSGEYEVPEGMREKLEAIRAARTELAARRKELAAAEAVLETRHAEIRKHEARVRKYAAV